MTNEKLVQALLAWFRANARDLPWRRTRDPYAIWVSEIMLQQTQVKTVLPYWERWMRALPRVELLARARPDKLHKLWEGLGYYTRVRNMQKAAQVILDAHGGMFPADFEDVLALPGIGRYTAGAICSIAFNQPTPILDGNVMRVLTRVFAIPGDPRDKEVNAQLWELSQALVQQAAASQAKSPAPPHATRNTQHAAHPFPHLTGPCSALNQSLMELGALICTPREPQCGICPVAPHCRAREQGRVAEFPQTAPRPKPTQRRFVAFVLPREDAYLACQRPAGVVNAHLWEFPNVEVALEETDLSPATHRALGRTGGTLVPLCTIKHTITRYRIQLEVFRVSGGRPAAQEAPGAQWLTLSQLKRLPFTSAHKKILALLG